jgi:hypothetical protein
METLDLIRYDLKLHDYLDEFEEMLHDLEFTYNTTHLAMAGLPAAEIDMALRDAMKVCRMNGVHPSEHFRSIYIFDEKDGDTYCDWRMTDRGFALVIMNAPHTNKAIARWQWELSGVVQLAVHP